MKFFKKKGEDGPPDVGKEGEIESKGDVDSSLDIPSDNPEDSSYEEEDSEEKPASKKKAGGKKKFKSVPKEDSQSDSESDFQLVQQSAPQSFQQSAPQSFQQSAQQSFSENRNNLELEKINARLELMNSMMKSFNERFSLINQQIGEIRTMSVANEKNLSLSNLDAKKVIELVKEVTPEKLRLDYRRADLRLSTLAEKLDANKQFMDSMMEELKELKRKANLFEGTDALLKLNEDVKKDIIEIQKVNSRVRMNADKSEQIFIELSKGFQENQKMNQVIANLDTSYSGVKKDVEKLNIDLKDILSVNDFKDFKRTLESKFIILENTLSEVEHIKIDNDRLSKIIERILFMEKRNEEDIANIGLRIGNADVKKMDDYEQELFSFLELMDKMAVEINKVKEKVGIKTIPYARKPFVPVKREEKLFIPPARREEPLFPAEINLEEEIPLVIPLVTPQENILNENPKLTNKDEVNDLLLTGENCLAVGNLPDAVKIYEEISDLYNPAEDENNLIYPKIIQFYQRLSGTVNNSASAPINYNSDITNAHPQSQPQSQPQPANNMQYKRLSDY